MDGLSGRRALGSTWYDWAAFLATMRLSAERLVPAESRWTKLATTVSPRIQSRCLLAESIVPPSQALPKPRTSLSRWFGVSRASESARMAYAGETAYGLMESPHARVWSS